MLHLFVLSLFLASSLAATTEQQLNYMTNHMKALTRQVMLQQFFVEQRVRTEGQSGIKITRLRSNGGKNFHVNSHSGYSAAAIHDHANNDRTVGLGELTAVINGVEFTTRHNDYRLNMPHRTSTKYNAYEPVPFPDVPPEVTSKPTIKEQVLEMREWFKAWRDQDYSKRDYRKYFKPTLCYMEGAWTQSGKNIDEPFASDRHFVDATSWMDLHEKARYVAQSGAKSQFENLSFLPTKIMGLLHNDTIPDFAQWNYRIMCHPVKRDIPLNLLYVTEDLSARILSRRSMLRHKLSRGARFTLNPKEQKGFYNRIMTWKSLIDEIMEEIPGKNNYPANLEDEGLDVPTLNLDKTKLNAGYYHRWFTIGKDAMGSSRQHRGYNDDFLFAALTTQPKVAGVQFNKCLKNPKRCYPLKQRWTWAIPLELIYLTPLSKWNPYGLKHHGTQRWDNLRIITANGRNGDCENGKAKAFNGTNSRIYYRTPSEFYSGASVDGQSAADTARGVTCVLDQNNVPRAVRASGTHVFLPRIEDVGVLRTRYPIFPVHGEGSSVWKELNALREISMDKDNWQMMYWKEDELHPSKYQDATIDMGYSRSTKTSKHTHSIQLTQNEVYQLKGGLAIEKQTDEANGHMHTVQLKWAWWRNTYYFDKCDGSKNCWDLHQQFFVIAGN